MPDQRIQAKVERGQGFAVMIDGETVTAHDGETLAAAMIAQGIWAFRRDKAGQPRAPYCNMGVCFECLLLVADPTSEDAAEGKIHWHRVRACMTLAKPGMTVRRVWP